MARDVNVSWVYPTTRESGLPLDPADIAGMTLEMSVDGSTWGLYNTFAANVVSTVVPELEIGEHFFRGTVLDTEGRSSAPLVGSVIVPDETPPGPLANLEVTLV